MYEKGGGGFCLESICWEITHLLLFYLASGFSAGDAFVDYLAYAPLGTNYPQATLSDGTLSKVSPLVPHPLMVVPHKQY